MKRILIVEDEDKIARFLELELVHEGYEVVKKHDGRSGLEAALSGSFSLMRLDIMLPGIDGIAVCRMLRANPDTAHAAIVMLTAKGEECDIVAGLDAGANDYVTKPFAKNVLLARIRAALRRDGAKTDERIEIDSLVLDDSTHCVSIDGEEPKLTLTEYRILELLMRNPGRVFDRAKIIDRISGGEKIVTSRTIDVQMVSLRRKLGSWSRHLETIRGVGYRLNENA